MAISSVGIGSGLDVEKIIKETVALEKEPIKTLEVKAETINSKISTYGQIKSSVDTLNNHIDLFYRMHHFYIELFHISLSPNPPETSSGHALKGEFKFIIFRKIV